MNTIISTMFIKKKKGTSGEKQEQAWFELNTSIIDGKALTMWYLILDCSL